MTPPPTARSPSPRTLVLAGALALATAMGIGRFAFTPLLPMMLNDGVITLAAASWLASANYLGYLAGALFCTLQPWLWRRLGLPPVNGASWVRIGLAATVVLTLGMVLPWPGAWAAMRFAAGVASALVFVFTSGWCLAQLARHNATALGGAIYAGPGLGIVGSGLSASALVAGQGTAATGWLVFGVLAALLTTAVWRVFGQAGPPAPVAAGSHTPAAGRAGVAELACFALAYGLAGFGYIITATFLPVIARAALPGSPWIDLFWPLFGLGVVVGALLATRIRGVTDLRWLLVAAYLMQASGIAIGLWQPSLAGFALGSLLLGLPFTALTFFAMQEARRLWPAAAASYMGLITALYGLGQILGPAWVAVLLQRSRSTAEGFDLALETAAAALLAGAALYAALIRVCPRTRAR